MRIPRLLRSFSLVKKRLLPLLWFSLTGSRLFAFAISLTAIEFEWRSGYIYSVKDVRIKHSVYFNVSFQSLVESGIQEVFRKKEEGALNRFI